MINFGGLIIFKIVCQYSIINFIDIRFCIFDMQGYLFKITNHYVIVKFDY